MQLFRGWWRRLVLIPLSTLLLGWLVYVVGFTLLMVRGDASSHHPRMDYLPHYIAVAAPPCLVVLAGFHATLFGLASSILGLFAAVLSVACFSGVGYVLYTCAFILYGYLDFGKDKGRDMKYILMFTGTLLSTLSWLAVMVMWNYFPYKLPWGTVHSFDDVVDEDGNMTPPPPPIPKDPPPFAGVARKVAMVVLMLEAASWCVLITGIDDQVHWNSSITYYHTSEEPVLSFGTWVVCIVGVLLVLSAVLHAAANGSASALMGIMTSVLSILYVTCLGHLVFSVSIDIYHRCRDGRQCTVSTIPNSHLYQLFGGVASGVLWAGVLALWPFYFKPVENSRGLHRSVQQQREYYFQNRNYERMPLLYQSNEHPPTVPVL